MFFTVVITVYATDQVFLPRALTCLRAQQFQDFEVIVVVDGDEPLHPYEPERLCKGFLPARVVYRPRSRTTGFRERYHGLGLAQGRYIAWLNVDNLVFPDWLARHHTNAIRQPGAVSVVHIHYWHLAEYWGVFPRELAYGQMDLLNYAVPVELARRVEMFGPQEEALTFADWVAFERCARAAPVVWDPHQPPCAAHF